MKIEFTEFTLTKGELIDIRDVRNVIKHQYRRYRMFVFIYRKKFNFIYLKVKHIRNTIYKKFIKILFHIITESPLKKSFNDKYPVLVTPLVDSY